MFRPLFAASILAAVACAGPGLAAGQSGGADCSGLEDPDSFVVSDPDGAIEDCTRIVQGAGTPRERAIAAIDRAVAYSARANFGKSADVAADRAAAAADFDAAVRLDPSFAFACYARGVGAFFSSRRGEVADFDAAIRLDPDFALAYLGRARAWWFKGDYGRADADFSAAIRLDAKLARAYLGRGAIGSMAGDGDRAIADLSEALRLSPGERNTHVRAAELRGMAFFAEGEAERAVADFGDAIELEPADARTLQYRGVVQLMRGSVDLARADLQRASDLAPGNAEAARWREIADRRAHARGRLAEAAEKLDMRHWPASAVHAFLGEPTSPTMLEEAAADDAGSAVIGRLQTCQAYVFTGELALLRQAKADAAAAFAAADEACMRGGPERGVVAAELKSLGGRP